MCSFYKPVPKMGGVGVEYIFKFLKLLQQVTFIKSYNKLFYFIINYVIVIYNFNIQRGKIMLDKFLNSLDKLFIIIDKFILWIFIPIYSLFFLYHLIKFIGG
jgi:hypothetical protein